MSGLVETLWCAVGNFCQRRAERANERSSWWASLARECFRRARGERKARR